MGKYFSKIDVRRSDDGLDLVEGLTYLYEETAPRMTPEEVRFKHEIDRTELRVQGAFADRKVRSDLLFALSHVMAHGLGGPKPDVQNGLAEFESYKEAVASQAKAIRDRRIGEAMWVGLVLFIISVSMIVLWLLARANGEALAASLRLTASENVSLASASGALGGYCFSIAGIALGSLFCVFLLNRNLSFDTFDRINVYRMTATQYAVYLGVLSAVVCVVLAFGWVQIGLGNVLLNDFVRQPPIGLVVGLMCSISEPLIATVLPTWWRPSSRIGATAVNKAEEEATIG